MKRLRALTRAPLFRFALVGGLNTLIGFTAFVAIAPYLPIPVATFLASLPAMLFSFLVNGRFTFGQARPTWRAAMLFLGTTGLILWVIHPALILAGLQFLPEPHHRPDLALVNGVVVLLCLGLNFLAYRYVVWPARRGKSPLRVKPSHDRMAL